VVSGIWLDILFKYLIFLNIHPMLVLKSLTLEEKIKCCVDGYGIKSSQTKNKRSKISPCDILQIVIDDYK
jgi:hypothetical protein